MTTPREPSGEDLLRREAQSRRQGSGIEAETLIGEWWLAQLWSREGAEQPTNAALLRSLGASLAIAWSLEDTGVITSRLTALTLRNRVRLGALTLQFSGPGWLAGKRPLLRFRFERMALLWGERELWHSTLPAPAEQRLPFFALIAGERSGDQGWLAARGRGGGLALWRLRSSAVRG